MDMPSTTLQDGETGNSAAAMDVNSPASAAMEHNASASHQDDRQPPNEERSDQDEEAADEGPPLAKYEARQKVLARDPDGLLYEAIVRRSLYGLHYHKQVEMGLVQSMQEARELLDQYETEEGWHYFVHYNNWNVKWDRWVSEDDVLEYTDDNKAYASLVSKEHAALRQQLAKKVSGKKMHQTIDGAEFLREWRKRKEALDEELKSQKKDRVDTDTAAASAGGEATKVASTDSNNKRRRTATGWTKALVEKEVKLREKSLTTKRKPTYANKISIPFALKKGLVENWEVISQCHMVSSLPAAVSIRQALDQYLLSKDVVVNRKQDDVKQSGKAVHAADETAAEVQSSKEGQAPTAENAETSHVADAKAEGAGPEEAGAAEVLKNDTSMHEEFEHDPRQQEWLDMANGIVMLFEEALPQRILYREEIPQFRALNVDPELGSKPYSEIYGCEYLLRLFVRLPEMLADELDDCDSRGIVAKVNDLVRFLNKNETTLFQQSHRKLNDLELKEQKKMMKSEERKRKLAETAVVVDAAADDITSKRL